MKPLVWSSCALALALASPSNAQVMQRVSVSSSGAQANGSSGGGFMSSNARYVAFMSNASNLVPGDTNGLEDIFLRDRRNGTTVLASVSSSGAQANGFCYSPSVSDDGRYVAFTSSATNLVPGDTNGVWDVFVRDLQSGSTMRISVDSTGSQADAYSHGPVVSADGHAVLFYSEATNLVAGDTNGFGDAFVRDLQNGTTERVSVGPGGVNGDGTSRGSSLTPDGRFVVFGSVATNLVAGDTNGQPDIFVRDRRHGTTHRISYSLGGTPMFGASFGGSISADGRWIAFTSEDIGGVQNIYLRDRQLLTTTQLTYASVDCQAVRISGDGSQIIFERGGFYLEVMFYDIGTGNSGAPVNGDGDCISSGISFDGRYVAFDSELPTIIPGDTNGHWDVFVRGGDVTHRRICDPGAMGAIGCPCLNPPAYADRACDNSSLTGGASIGAQGGAFLSSDGLTISCFGQKPNELAIVVQATSSIPGGVVYGQGVRCFGGSLKRLYTRTPLGGFTAPDVALGEQPIHARSAALGQPIPPGGTRWYAVVYRDPIVLGGCPAWSTFNTTQTMEVSWLP